LFAVGLVADETAGQGTGGGTDQRTLTAVARTTGGGARKRSDHTTNNRTGAGIILGAIGIHATGQQHSRADDHRQIQFQILHIQTIIVSDI
jgi:hypothetical protein